MLKQFKLIIIQLEILILIDIQLQLNNLFSQQITKLHLEINNIIKTINQLTLHTLKKVMYLQLQFIQVMSHKHQFKIIKLIKLMKDLSKLQLLHLNQLENKLKFNIEYKPQIFNIIIEFKAQSLQHQLYKNQNLKNQDVQLGYGHY